MDDRRKVQDDVDKDRKHAIEAAIVRIMKSRKALQHQQVCTRMDRISSPLFEETVWCVCLTSRCGSDSVCTCGWEE